MGDTKIQWADKVWNPTTGCTKVSQGCKFCYAETIAKRFWATEYPANADGSPRKFTDVRLHPERLEDPLHWRMPQRVFVDSMSDLFHPDVPELFIDDVFNVMSYCNHTFMILTKRPQRMMEYLQAIETQVKVSNAWDNVWVGVSVEDQMTADERIPLLLQTPAAIRFVSYEPALKAVDFGKYLFADPERPNWARLNSLHWLIMGCESGPNARPMDIEWVRSVRDQCVAAGVPFFFKQKRIGKTILHTPSLDGVYWQQFPEMR